MKKYISVTLIVITVICAIMPFYVFAGIGVESDSVALLQEGDYDIYNADDNGNIIRSSSIASNACIDKIYNGLKNVSSTISNLSTYKVSLADMKVLYSSIINDHPDLFYVSSSISFRYSEITGYVSSITPQYAMTSSEISDAKIVFNNGVNKALALIDSSMNDVQKALVLHDYLCTIARYPNSASSGQYDNELYHSAYAIFKDGDTVCAGYALAYSYLLQMVGVPCVYVSSDFMSHAWNAVQLDGEWYYVDLTYDDIGYYGDYNVNSAMHHRCFLKSEEMLSSEYCFCHSDYIKPSEVVCVSTKYDDYFWNDIDTNIFVVNGEYYYPSLNISTKTATINKRDANGNDKVLSNKFDFYYFTLTSTVVDSDGEHSVSFNEPLVRMIYYDNRFYITAMNKLYSLDLNGDFYIVYTADKLTTMSIFIGIDNVKSGVVLQSRSNIGDPLVLKQMDYFMDCFKNNAKYNNFADKDNNGYLNAIDYLLIR